MSFFIFKQVLLGFFSPWMGKAELVFTGCCGDGCADTHPTFVFNGDTTDLGIKYQIFTAQSPDKSKLFIVAVLEFYGQIEFK